MNTRDLWLWVALGRWLIRLGRLGIVAVLAAVVLLAVLWVVGPGAPADAGWIAR